MVKGISKQVIVVNSPDKKLFDQAIFFLSEQAIDSGGISDAALLKEAKRLLHNPSTLKKKSLWHYMACSSAGAVLIGLIWLFSSVL